MGADKQTDWQHVGCSVAVSAKANPPLRWKTQLPEEAVFGAAVIGTCACCHDSPIIEVLHARVATGTRNRRVVHTAVLGTATL